MVYVLLGEGFEEIEAIVPTDVLRRAGVEVALVGLEDTVVVGGQGITMQADMTLDEVEFDEIEMLILPGGIRGVESIQMNLFATALIQRAYDNGAYLAAICAAPTILARMGMLDRRRGVCYPGMEDEMGSAIVAVGESLVQDGHIITARGAGNSFEFALKLVEVLKGQDASETVRCGICYQS